MDCYALCAISWAGADVLFVEPSGKAGDIGVTVSPVRIKSLEQFGDLKAVGDRLLAAESSKVDTYVLLTALSQGCKQDAMRKSTDALAEVLSREGLVCGSDWP